MHLHINCGYFIIRGHNTVCSLRSRFSTPFWILKHFAWHKQQCDTFVIITVRYITFFLDFPSKTLFQIYMEYCLDSNYFRIFFSNNLLLCLCLFLISRPSHQFHQLCHFFNFFISLIISFFRIGTVHVSNSSTVCFSFSASSGCSGCERLKHSWQCSFYEPFLSFTMAA